MMKPPIKSSWIEQAVEIRKFHIQQLKDESNWTIQKTADILNRSTGSVSQCLLIASWLKTHEKHIKRMNSMKDALKFIKTRQREMELCDD